MQMQQTFTIFYQSQATHNTLTWPIPCPSTYRGRVEKRLGRGNILRVFAARMAGSSDIESRYFYGYPNWFFLRLYHTGIVIAVPHGRFPESAS